MSWTRLSTHTRTVSQQVHPPMHACAPFFPSLRPSIKRPVKLNKLVAHFHFHACKWTFVAGDHRYLLALDSSLWLCWRFNLHALGRLRLRLVVPRAVCFTAAQQCPLSTSWSFTNFVSTTRTPKCNHIANFAPSVALAYPNSFGHRFLRLRVRLRLSSFFEFPWFWHHANYSEKSQNYGEKSHSINLLACNFESLSNVIGEPMIYRQCRSGKNYRDIVETSYIAV